MFVGRADFEGVEFEAGATFFSATFSDRASFSGATFNSLATFFSAMFNGGADFSIATFSDRANFGSTTFSGGAGFFRATFGDRANFGSATFGDQATFFSTTFSDRANFLSATFNDWAIFSGATFSGLADFGSAMFSGLATFSYATFNDLGSFSGATFSGGSDFSIATFSDKAIFLNTYFSARALFAGPAPDERSPRKPIFTGTEVDFRQVALDPDCVIFRNADLQGIRFLDTDVRKIEFTSIRWPTPGGITHLYDEFYYHNELDKAFYEKGLAYELQGKQKAAISDWKKSVPWGKIETLYRRLKQNYEDQKDFSQGGNFHYREKEMQRLNPDCTPGRRVLLTLYKLLGGYGERVGPPLLVLLALTTVCFFLYAALSQMPAQALLHSLETAFFLRPDPLEKAGLAGAFIQFFQTVLSPVLLGLLALSIRQRVKR